MYKEANTIYLHNNLSQWEQDEIIHCQNQRQSATLYINIRMPLVIDNDFAMPIRVMNKLIASHD